jgi:hypothetical protein
MQGQYHRLFLSPAQEKLPKFDASFRAVSSMRRSAV